MQFYMIGVKDVKDVRVTYISFVKEKNLKRLSDLASETVVCPK